LITNDLGTPLSAVFPALEGSPSRPLPCREGEPVANAMSETDVAAGLNRDQGLSEPSKIDLMGAALAVHIHFGSVRLLCQASLLRSSLLIPSPVSPETAPLFYRRASEYQQHLHDGAKSLPAFLQRGLPSSSTAHQRGFQLKERVLARPMSLRLKPSAQSTIAKAV